MHCLQSEHSTGRLQTSLQAEQGDRVHPCRPGRTGTAEMSAVGAVAFVVAAAAEVAVVTAIQTDWTI